MAPRSGRLNPSSFVVLGEGLAAGMGSFSLSSETQKDSFPAQLARQMGATFTQPLFQPPGIGGAIGFAPSTVVVPSPLQSTVFEQLPPELASNLSVPGLTVSEAIRLRPRQPLICRTSAKQTAVNLILGIQGIAYGAKEPLPTQLESAVRQKPTLALVVLGYAEALEAMVSADPTHLPSPNAFREDYSRILRELRSAGAEVIVCTIPDPLDTAHFSTVNAAAEIVKLDPGILLELWRLLPDDRITANGLNEIAFQLLEATFGAPLIKAIETLSGGSTIGSGPANQIKEALKRLNAEIWEAAEAKGAIVYDLNAYFRNVHEKGVVVGQRRLTGDYLGGFYSLNGYYPGATGQALVANQILDLLNKKFGASFPPVELQTVIASDPVAAYRPALGPKWTREDLVSPRLPVPGGPVGSTRTPSRNAGDSPPLGAISGHILQLPAGLEEVLPLNPHASYFGDAISAS